MSRDSRQPMNQEVKEQLKERGKAHGKIRFPMYLTKELQEADISELELSVRSSNCLHRAGVKTVGDLVQMISRSDDLRKIRNCGSKSVHEIMSSLFMYQFQRLRPAGQRVWLQKVTDLSALTEEEAASVVGEIVPVGAADQVNPAGRAYPEEHPEEDDGNEEASSGKKPEEPRRYHTRTPWVGEYLRHSIWKEDTAPVRVRHITIEEDRRIVPGQKVQLSVAENSLEADIDVLNLSVRAFNCLKRSGIYTIGELVRRLEGDMSLMQIHNLGQKSAREIADKLEAYLQA